MELFDDLYSGVPSVAAAEIRAALGLSYHEAALTLLFVPGAIALLIEPWLFVLADRYPRKWFVCGGIAAMGLAAIAAAFAPSALWLAPAIAVAWVGSGAGVALSQATLVDVHPDQPERMLARWTLLGEIGDLGGPALLAALAYVGFGWRTAFVMVGALALVIAASLWGRTFPDARDDDDEPGILESLRAAVSNRALLAWLGAAALCDLLDELVMVFAALRLRDELGFSPYELSFVAGTAVVGAIAGAWATDRLLARFSPLRLLLVTSVLATIAYGAWLLATDVWLSAALFGLVGLTVAPMYPITIAQAYAALPGRSGTVNAAGHLFTPLTLALPFVLGALADATDVQIALAVLLAQPVGLALLAVWALSRARLSEEASD